MSRMLAFSLVALSLCALAHITPRPAAAQGRAAKTQETRRARPQGQAMRVPKVDATMMRILRAWYAGTSQIKTLEGVHYKYTYDEVFAVEKRGHGKFYYVSPDKGRIDVYPAPPRAGEKSERFTKKKPHRRFTLDVDKAVQWICDGKVIARIDPAKKEGERFDIPPKAQGRNIMEGPLPFLLGMPPNLAIRRYDLKLIQENAKEVWLEVTPKWKQDLANYSIAKVVLKKDNYYLPSAVLMLDTAKTLETVYTFDKMIPNKRSFWPKKDPYKVPTDIKIINAGSKQVQRRGRRPGSVRIQRNPKPAAPVQRKIADNKNFRKLPDLRGYKWKEINAELKKRGYQVITRKGSIAKRTDQLYCIEDQYPRPNTECENGCKVYLKVFISATDVKPENRTTAKPNNSRK